MGRRGLVQEEAMEKRELVLRTKKFALDILQMVETLPRSRSGNIVAGQLGRAGTSVGANYRAACRARSRKEFVAKVGVVEEEADESAFWIELSVDAKLQPPERARSLWKEADELTRIMAKSRITAKRKLRSAHSAIGIRQSAIAKKQSQ
jgi:four helix bundle protein